MPNPSPGYSSKSINIGLPLFICSEEDKIADGAEMEIDMAEGIDSQQIRALNPIKLRLFRDFLREIVDAGGLVEYTRRQVSRRCGI